MTSSRQQNILNTNHNFATSTPDNSHKIHLLEGLLARNNPFADLVKLSLLHNPREFELPEEYIPNIHFPGTSKKLIVNMTTREGRYTSYSVKRAQESDRNNLPLILRTCYFCRKGCRKAPLIHCDYCPLVYHADCIDPPLTILPNTRWMCPNHVEPVAEEKLLSTSSFCERVKLWNHFSKPIDHESIKISFLEKVHQDFDPEFDDKRSNIKLGCIVPKKVKQEYARFIVSIEKFNGDPGSEHEEEIEHLHEPGTSKEMNKEALKEHNIPQRSDSTSLEVGLRYMIESSKLLELADYCLKQNGDRATLMTNTSKD